MDAYDIFKKLSKGAKYTKKNTNSNQATVVPIIKSDDKVKVKTESSAHQTGDTQNTSITLLGDITSTGNKPDKKRKSPDLQSEKRRQELRVEEEVNRFRNIHNINVVGRHIPEPARAFNDFKIGQDLIENLVQLGYKDPTPIQMQAVPLMLANRQILACAPTGSGKTAAFLLPLLEALGKPSKNGYRALIICPTRELAIQTQKVCMHLADNRKLKPFTINKVNMIKIGDILITTPNRLCFLLNQDEKVLNLGTIEWVVIDEADKLFEDGVRSFKDQLKQILDACTLKTKRIAMFSATYTPMVAKWCVKNMKGLVRVTIGQRNTATDLIEQHLEFVGNESGKLLAFRDLVRKGLTPPVLVFVQSKERAQQLFSELIYDGINVDAIHADRTQLQRENTVKSFREGKIWVLICTELMARGIDFKGVNLVINYDFPPSSISYVHRIGRAGRAGMKGKAITYFTLDDTVNLRSIAHVIKESGCEVPDYMLYMKKHSKKEKKQMAVSAMTRDDILTVPYDERLRVDKALGKKRLIDQFRKQKKLNEKKQGAAKKMLKGGKHTQKNIKSAGKAVKNVKNAKPSKQFKSKIKKSK